MRFASLVVSLCAMTGLSAVDGPWYDSELPFVHVRLGLSLVPLPEAFEITTRIHPEFGGGTVHYEDHIDESRAPAISYAIVGGIVDPHGPVYGIELMHANTSLRVVERVDASGSTPTGNDPSSLQYRTLGCALLAGQWRCVKDCPHAMSLA